MKRIVPILIMLIYTLSCERQSILDSCDCTDHAKLPISIDWSKSGITPQNVTLLFYSNAEGNLAFEHIYEHNSNAIQSYAHIPAGEYTVVVFNELRNQIKNMTIRGDKNLSTLEFHASENTDVAMHSTEQKYINTPGMLGLQTIRNLVVTSEMIDYTHGNLSTKVSDYTKTKSEILLNLEPENKVNLSSITLHVNGLNNARMPALVNLKSISEGYMVDKNENSTKPTTIQFNMNNRTYDSGSTVNGTISTQITLFGTLGDRNSIVDHTKDTQIILEVFFKLVDKEKTLVSQSINITNHITFDKEKEGAINFPAYISLDKALPDVEPEDDGDSGFDSELEDWDIIDIPL